MAERLNAAHSKCVVPLGTGGSNPPLSATFPIAYDLLPCNYTLSLCIIVKKGKNIMDTAVVDVTSNAISQIVFIVFYPILGFGDASYSPIIETK